MEGRNALRRAAVPVLVVIALYALFAPAAGAYEFPRPLRKGAEGKDVKALQMRIAGWYPEADQDLFQIDGAFGKQTRKALKAMQEFYGLRVNGRAGKKVFALIDSLEDDDGSTANFDWSEFTQNESSSCSAQANSYAGTFAGGPIPPRKVKKNVKRLMWKLEAIRAKAGDRPIGINSGFRSTSYNECIGGASASQHLFGTAADNRVVKSDNGDVRDLARASQIEGIGCYSDLTHNHFDIRIDNSAQASTQTWWWPEQDRKGRDLDYRDKPCWGEKKKQTVARPMNSGPAIFAAILERVAGIGSFVPSAAEIEVFESAGEVTDLGGAD